MTQDEPTYGAADFYAGPQGEAYLSYQRPIAEFGARLNVRKFAPHIRRSDTVLDFGCGVGAILAHLDCGDRLGVEINPAARTEALARGITCVADLDGVADKSVDVVISNHALEHVPYPVDALRQMKEKLKPAGKLVLCVPIDDWRMEERYNPEDPNHHLHTWTPLLLGNTLTEAGFAVAPDDIRILTHAWPPLYTRLSQIMPERAFDLLARFWAVVIKRRQLLAVVRAA